MTHAHLTNLDDRIRATLTRPALMGIVNVTPNSFSDGNQFLDPAAAVAHGRQLIRDGAVILDVGAEASSFFRPGVEPVPAAEQLRRLLPVVDGLKDSGAILSVDTRSAEVAREAVAAGAHLVNDISAGEHDPAMLGTVAGLGVPVILMHISPCYPGNPAADDRSILKTVSTYLNTRAAAAVAAGVPRHRVWVDPGVGFGKTQWENVELSLVLPQEDGSLPCPLVLGVSRKRFLDAIWQEKGVDGGRERLAALAHLAAHDRDLATALVVHYHASFPMRAHGLVHRVHNVKLCAEVIRLATR